MQCSLHYFGEEVPGSPFTLRPLPVHKAATFGDNFGVDEERVDAAGVCASAGDAAPSGEEGALNSTVFSECCLI